MQAAILSIGTELTRGELVDTNAAWLSERLTELGIELLEHVSVPDDIARIVASMQRLSQEVALVICTGGLGPTSDDLTTAAAAQALDVSLVRDQAILDKIRQRFEALGRRMPELNQKQADLPEGSALIDNPVGTAPGFSFKLNQAMFYVFPGVPHEMKKMFIASALPTLRQNSEQNTHQIHLRSFGFTESGVAEKLSDLESKFPSVTLGYRASFPEIEVKVHALEENAALAEQRAEEVAAIVRERLGEAVFGGRGASYAAAVGEALRDKGWTLAIAESCTGGLIASMLTKIAGSSDFLLLDTVTYANSAKERVLEVEPETLLAQGAVSQETAIAMAEGVRKLADAEIALSTTGIAGPEGGSKEKPVGTVWLALAQRGGETLSERRTFPGNREQVQTLAAYFGLRMLRRAALDIPVLSS